MRREGMAQVVDAQIGQLGLLAHVIPEPLEFDERLAFRAEFDWLPWIDAPVGEFWVG